MRSENRQQLLIILTGVVVGLFLFDKIVITPLLEGWRTRSELIAELRKSIDSGDSLIEREDITRNRWDAMKTNALPLDASDAEEAALEAFDKWSRATRISISSIKPQWKRGAAEDHSLLECRVDASGDIDSLTQFLYEVEKSTLALRVESVEITARDSEGRQLALGLLVSGLRLAPLDYK